jgi:hypothetical protein
MEVQQTVVSRTQEGRGDAFTKEQEEALEEMLGAARRVANLFGAERAWGSAAREIADELSASLPPPSLRPLQRAPLDQHPSRSLPSPV